jgi:hypothetical protein
MRITAKNVSGCYYFFYYTIALLFPFQFLVWAKAILDMHAIGLPSFREWVPIIFFLSGQFQREFIALFPRLHVVGNSINRFYPHETHFIL